MTIRGKNHIWRVYAPAPPLRKHAPGAFYLGRQSELARSRRYYKPQRVSIRRYRWVGNRSNVSSGSWSSWTWPARMRSVASGGKRRHSLSSSAVSIPVLTRRHRSAFRADRDRRGAAGRDKGGFLPDRSSRPPGLKRCSSWCLFEAISVIAGATAPLTRFSVPPYSAVSATHSHSIVLRHPAALIHNGNSFRWTVKHRLPDPSKIRALEFKDGFRRPATSSVSSTIEINWSNLL